ncbi:winged helix-turn-helix transcriptional regulator [Deinococcus sp. 14RED07]|uniref:ArsR/SmtB family transcription factor n=1 Tax=Deinococcus sp. 14RED07 TaxID=2745874 RepID=UPI001E2B55FB|nr:winged helix-turn-helix domain-containing protein [Deinococcus sp. 14RED07]MCD0175658.1 winged helix-turn-helix transcriptional regulator [Deinococcus sp. 14RED07]
MAPDDTLSEEQKIDYIYRYVAERREGTTGVGEGRPQTAPDQLWAVNELQRRAAGTPGRIAFAGMVATPSADPHLWQQEADVTQLMRLDWASHSRTLEALSHPVRLRILQAILGGAHTVQEFALLPSMGTTGQIYHHLRELLAVDWIRANRRNHYEITPNRVVPLLVAMLSSLNSPVEDEG